MELLEPDMVEECLCADVDLENVDEDLQIAQDMIKVCAENGGVGLAGPQVGVYKRIFVWMVSDTQFQVILNPKYYPDGKKKIHTVEGCLTYPG